MAEVKKAKAISKLNVSTAESKAGAKKITTAKSVAAVEPKVAVKSPLSGGNAQQKVKAEMSNLKDKVTDTARDAAERSKDRASEAVSGIGKFIRDNADAIDANVGKNYGDYARRAADAADNFATKVDDKQVNEIVGDARDLIRKSPAVAVGAAAAIGFVISRLIRSGRDDV